MPRFASQAEYYRHHRQCMELAQELRVTPLEAELEMRKREVNARFAETHRRFLAATKPRPLPDREPDEQIADQPWMMRD